MPEKRTSKPMIAVILLSVIACCFVGYVMYQRVMAARSARELMQQNGYLEVDLKSMGDFELDRVIGTIDDVPAVDRALDGKKVQLDGQMWNPNGVNGRIDTFVLVDSMPSSSHAPIKVQKMVLCTVPQNHSVQYYPNHVRVLGTLHVKVEQVTGVIQSLYKLDVDSAKPQ